MSGGWHGSDQRAIEQDAVRLMRTPAAERAARDVGERWHDHVRPGPHYAARFAFEFEQCRFIAALNAINRDASAPRIHAIGGFGEGEVPGSNYGHGNPDCIYRTMPVEPGARYVLRGRFARTRPAVTQISLVDGDQGFLGNIASGDLAVDADGGFEVLLDPEPGAGPNRLANVAGAYNLCVRDILGDLGEEAPAELAIERLTPASLPGDTAEDRYPALLARLVQEVIDFETRTIRPRAANDFSSPAIHASGPFIPSQSFAMGHYAIDDAHALVFCLDPGGAGYAILPATNVWGGIGDFPGHVRAWNNRRAVPDADGAFHAVLSLTDPGVANWIDPEGSPTGTIVARWADFRVAEPHPSLTARLVPLARLAEALPAETARLDPAGRIAQRARHGTAYRAAKG